MANTFGYAAGTAAATVDVPTGARLRAVRVIGAATVAIDIVGDITAGGDVVIGGTPTSYFCSWMT